MRHIQKIKTFENKNRNICLNISDLDFNFFTVAEAFPAVFQDLLETRWKFLVLLTRKDSVTALTSFPINREFLQGTGCCEFVPCLRKRAKFIQSF